MRSAFDMSERRACRVTGCVRMTVRYRSRRPDDAELRVRLRALAHVRRRFGYRRLLIFLRREGLMVNHKRLFRLYREERLMVRRRGGRKRASLGTRAPMMVPQLLNDLPNDRWSLDFVADQFIDGRWLRILVVVDDCTRECLALIADTSISGNRVARELDRLLVERGKPKMIVSDNGTELTSNAILRWADDHKIAWHYIAPSSAGSGTKWLMNSCERLKLSRVPTKRCRKQGPTKTTLIGPRASRQHTNKEWKLTKLSVSRFGGCWSSI